MIIDSDLQHVQNVQFALSTLSQISYNISHQNEKRKGANTMRNVAEMFEKGYEILDSLNIPYRHPDKIKTAQLRNASGYYAHYIEYGMRVFMKRRWIRTLFRILRAGGTVFCRRAFRKLTGKLF